MIADELSKSGADGGYRVKPIKSIVIPAISRSAERVRDIPVFVFLPIDAVLIRNERYTAAKNRSISARKKLFPSMEVYV